MFRMSGQTAGPIETKLDTRTHVQLSTQGVFLSRSMSRSFMYACGSDRIMKHPERCAKATPGERCSNYVRRTGEATPGERLRNSIRTTANYSSSNEARRRRRWAANFGASRTPSRGRVITARRPITFQTGQMAPRIGSPICSSILTTARFLVLCNCFYCVVLVFGFVGCKQCVDVGIYVVCAVLWQK